MPIAYRGFFTRRSMEIIRFLNDVRIRNAKVLVTLRR
jgi:hypothetical protein